MIILKQIKRKLHYKIKMFDNCSDYDFYYDHDHNKYYKNDIESQCYVNLKPKYIPRKSSYSLKDIKSFKEMPNDDDRDDVKDREHSVCKSILILSSLIIANVLYYYFVFVFTY